MNDATVEDSVRRTLSSIVTDNLAWCISWTGAYRKLQVNRLEIFTAVRGIILFYFAPPKSEMILSDRTFIFSEASIDSDIKKLLNRAIDCAGGHQY